MNVIILIIGMFYPLIAVVTFSAKFVADRYSNQTVVDWMIHFGLAWSILTNAASITMRLTQ